MSELKGLNFIYYLSNRVITMEKIATIALESLADLQIRLLIMNLLEKSISQDTVSTLLSKIEPFNNIEMKKRIDKVNEILDMSCNEDDIILKVNELDKETSPGQMHEKCGDQKNAAEKQEENPQKGIFGKCVQTFHTEAPIKM